MRPAIQRSIASAMVVGGVFAAELHDPRVRVDERRLLDDVPALHLTPIGGGTHPKALLAHGVSASKETLFRFAERLASAGIECWIVDLPGHGESPLRFPGKNAEVIARAAHALGGVDVIVGHSMGAYAGAAAVRDQRVSPQLFVSLGALPELGADPPRHLLLAGRFEEVVRPEQLAQANGATLVLSAWSDHVLEPYDPRLIEAAASECRSQFQLASSVPSRRWLARLLAMPLAWAGALGFAITFRRGRGLLVAATTLLALGLSAGSWLSVRPNWPHLPMQLAAIAIVTVLAVLLGRARIPIWLPIVPAVSFALCGALVSGFWALIAALGTGVLAVGALLGAVAMKTARRLDGDIAFGIFVGYAIGQWVPVML